MKKYIKLFLIVNLLVGSIYELQNLNQTKANEVVDEENSDDINQYTICSAIDCWGV